MSPSPIVHVAVAAIVNERNEVLISLRAPQVHQGGLWEFPGGKIEPGESLELALQREIHEELGLTLLKQRPLIRVTHHYPDKSVLLDVHLVSKFSGRAEGREGQEIRWLPIAMLGDYPFPAANHPIIRSLQLPSRYLITPEPDLDRIDLFLATLKKSLSQEVSLIQLRAKKLHSDQYIRLAHQVLAVCRDAGARLLLNAAPEILNIVDADGIHLTSARLLAANERPVSETKLLSVACHSIAEIEQARLVQADLGLISPVKTTASHPDSTPLGWTQFRALTDQANFPAYALGGMAVRDLDDAYHYGAQGVAGIGGFWSAD